MNEERLMSFVNKSVGDVGSALATSMVVIGDRLGLYRAMSGAGPMTSQELADKTSTAERYVREWLGAQAASGFVIYAGDDRYELPDEHAIPLTDENSPAFVGGAFESALGAILATDRITDAFRTGGGLSWGDQDEHVFSGVERFFRPGYVNYLTTQWIPAMDGVESRLQDGIRVLDVGCGHGASTIHMARTYPNSRFTGIDPHEGSIDTARKRAADAGVADRVSFEVATVGGVRGKHDMAAFFDCLHDLGDPVGALRSVSKHLDRNGSVLLVEPAAADDVSGNLNPVGAAYYGFSTLLCTPNSLSQKGKAALGAQAGDARLTEVAKQAGFTHTHKVAETPFNHVFELKH